MNVHITHCFQGEYEGSCKYGDEDCPARFVAPALARRMLEDSRYFGDEEAPFNGKAFDGDNRLLLIVGENASGKSLLFRILAAVARRDHGLTGITISIRERTDSTVPFRRMFMFGDEAEQSTGATSFGTIEMGFKTASGESQGKNLLMIDEPEMGLSDGYARALGEYLGQNARDLPDACHGLVVVTHNRPLVQGILMGLNAAPAFAHLGASTPLYDWLEHRETRTVNDLRALKETASARRKQTQKLMDQKD
ncbi:hypothetical protein HOU02_gp252 [Caulobacter phage CcrBL9]|uniref:Uncharacterized protein n=1 Tax=Caulobacter phage CcrBL9 TaxID=2283270 RepID=A0A385ECH0_9CAUD|nr:hypothetical protein HOU02_gp252 [Caulobacter phage CcrBL9]AXQ69473.1 hypothetical protein CcrBL9_gp449 [Caulobacter phage CcrBL9]